jgi:hypothetical protein
MKELFEYHSEDDADAMSEKFHQSSRVNPFEVPMILVSTL